MFNTTFYKDKVPEQHLEGLVAWGRKEHYVGHFLMAVLSNNLFEAFNRADDETIASMRYIVMFIQNELPLGCHGSPENVKAWSSSGFGT